MGPACTCAGATAALSHYLDGVLPLGPFLKVRMHLFGCPGCRALLATLRALPGLAAAALEPEPAEARSRSRLALAGALARLERGERGPRAGSRVPLAARRAMAAGPDLAMRLLLSTHAALLRGGAPAARPCPLPAATLERLPPREAWRWDVDPDGTRRAELLADVHGDVRLLLLEAPPDSRLPPHRHLGSESILILDGGLEDRGQEYRRGDWIHCAQGSCHAPRMAPSGCWCLIREQGMVRLLGSAAWLRRLGHAS